MRVAVYQFSPVFGQKGENLRRIEKKVREIEADLVVLPELCTTGYQFASADELEKLCETIPGGESVDRLGRICREKKMFIVGGIGEKKEDFYYNSAILMGPEGLVGVYRKVHLFDDEKHWFQAGSGGFSVWNIGFAKIGIMICFDWIFPEAARSLALQGAELICHPANLILPYCQDAMVTRCIENRVFAITANRIGSETRVNQKAFVFTGGSQIVNPRGKILFRMGREEEGIRVIDIEPVLARDKQVTPSNQLWEDRRPDNYRLHV